MDGSEHLSKFPGEVDMGVDMMGLQPNFEYQGHEAKFGHAGGPGPRKLQFSHT